MNHRLLYIKIIAALLMMLYFSGCTNKVPIRTWVPPQSAVDNIAAKVDYLIIVNPHKGELLYDIFENALRERFTVLPFLEVESSFDTAEIAQQLKNYNYIPRLPKKDRIAYLNFELKENHQLQRLQNSRVVNLHRCNNLIKSKKQQRCRIYAKETIKQGVQNLLYSQQVLFKLSDVNGNTIIAPQQIERNYKIRNKLIPDENLLRKKLSDLIAREYSKLVLPFRKKPGS